MLAVAFALNDTLLAATEIDPLAQQFAEEAGFNVARSLDAQRLRPKEGDGHNFVLPEFAKT